MFNYLSLASALLASAMLISTAVAKDMPVISQAEIVAKYGKPDRVTSAENERPRPPIVTKMIEYKKENVRIVLLANAPMGAAPPYPSWKLMGYQDPRDNKVLSVEEAERRLAGRKKK